MIGKAAHIHAAASGPGARRYLASMTREERIHITNAIWLCATHADLIDRDEVTYTADVLRAMKAEHEANCAARQRNAVSAGEAIPDLIAIGGVSSALFGAKSRPRACFARPLPRRP